MKRFNARAILLLLLAACFIASAFIPDFWIMVNYNLVFFVAFFCVGAMLIDDRADIIGLPLILHFQLSAEETSGQMKPCFNLLEIRFKSIHIHR